MTAPLSLRRPTVAWLVIAAVLAAGVTVGTVATLREGRDHPMCPEEAFGCVETGGPEGAIRVGAVLPLTGPRSADGEEALRGVELAISHRGGTLLDHPLRLVTRDDRCSADRIAVLARKLAIDHPESTPMAAVIGAACPEVTQPAAQILSDSGIPLLSWSSAEVSFVDPPPERSFYVPLQLQEPDDTFVQAYRERYGSEPASPWAQAAFDAAEVLLEAMERVAIQAPEGELLVPRVALRDALRAAT
jgi:ABC-type branched-subunit amino acid transport system substrate-binding protein